jgi:hypothetical protein
VCIARCFVYYFVDTKKGFGRYCPYLLVLAIPFLAIASWSGYKSLFIIVGLAINTVCMGILDIQKFRKSVWFTSSLLLTYNILEASYSGMIGDVMTITSAVVSYIRYNKTSEEK